ncbi:hypothetical protein [Sinorhizobium sp. CB7]
MTNTDTAIKSLSEAIDPIAQFRLDGRVAVIAGVSEGIVVVRARMGRMA